MQAHVICCNDGVMAVSLATKLKDAQEQMQELRINDFHREQRSKGILNVEFSDYCDTYYWHIHTVEVL